MLRAPLLGVADTDAGVVALSRSAAPLHRLLRCGRGRLRTAHRETDPVEAEPRGRGGAEEAVPLARREVGEQLLVGVVERLEPAREPGDRQVAAEHAAVGPEEVDERLNPRPGPLN